MFIDLLFAFIVVMAIVKGISKGLIMALFTFLGLFIGLAAALKLSAIVARWLQDSTSLNSQWLPFLAFILIMIGVIFLVKLGASFVEKALQFVLLGWINSIGGILLYLLLYTTLFSVILFFVIQLGVIKQETVQVSHVYPYIASWGPNAIECVGKILPAFKNIFHQLEDFFGSMAEKQR